MSIEYNMVDRMVGLSFICHGNMSTCEDRFLLRSALQVLSSFSLDEMQWLHR